MIEKRAAANRERISEGSWRRAGEEYLQERQTQVTTLLEAALIIGDIYSSEIYENRILAGQLPSGENVDITDGMPQIFIAVANMLSEELADLDAITPEIEDLWYEVEERFEDGVTEESKDEEETDFPDEPPFPPELLN